ncbi:hypothetical protein GOP47_0025855 [Adiantum capillus-veneris]|uniref:Uncharacterized protein n=1 Tax=Adiantum capillus-veneris TaxID=13818 RepID=A0A9D4U3L2_ADICA|nr:hypothetical protein GOP47_0025855 [Adiantum capillus-veneris]
MIPSHQPSLLQPSSYPRPCGCQSSLGKSERRSLRGSGANESLLTVSKDEDSGKALVLTLALEEDCPLTCQIRGTILMWMFQMPMMMAYTIGVIETMSLTLAQTMASASTIT